jgi:hypothetical protein
MAPPRVVQREWTENFIPGKIRTRCKYKRRGKRLLRFTVQLEIYSSNSCKPVVRYDNAHGFCHRDTIHADGTQEKTALIVGDINATFSHAIEDLKSNWTGNVARYEKDINP